MDASSLAIQVNGLVRQGNLRGLHSCLDEVKKSELIEDITKQYPDRDPIVSAIDQLQEPCALYLIEKGFPVNRSYAYASAQCDLWCAKEHGSEPCPTRYDAIRLARKRQLDRAALLLQEIQTGTRKPGDGLSEVLRQNQADFKQEKINTITNTTTHTCMESFKTQATLAKEKLEKLGRHFISKSGETPVHEAVSFGASLVYVAANAGLNINAKDFGGDTALHKSVRLDNMAVSRALLTCGADLSIRNKLGQLATDVATSNEMKNLLTAYKPGLVKAVQKGDHAALCRLVRLWSNPCCIIKKGKSALDMARSRKDEDANKRKCHQFLQQITLSLRLVHTVLAEDAHTLREILQNDSTVNVNTRYKGNHGMTPLSCAIEQGNADIVQILVDTKRSHLHTRVPEDINEPNSGSVPIFFKALNKDCPLELWRFLSDRVDSGEDFERDGDGNTPLMRAILNNKSQEFMAEFLRSTPFNRLVLRNKNGQTPHDIASSRDRADIVQLLDSVMLRGCGEGFIPLLPVSFFDFNKAMAIKSQEKKNLLEIADASNAEADVQSLRHFSEIQELGCRLFRAAAAGDVKTVQKLNTADYMDQNGFTALTRAVAFVKPQAAEALLTSRPELRLIGDNCNRYPLHYAYALPEKDSEVMVKVILSRAPPTTENKLDKDGREPVEYKDLRDTREIQQMLEDARTLDAFRQRVPPLVSLPNNRDDIMEPLTSQETETGALCGATFLVDSLAVTADTASHYVTMED